MGITKGTVEKVCCDRCGSEKDTRDTSGREWGYTEISYRGNTGGRDMWGNGAGSDHNGLIWVCLPCTKEFLKWLYEPKKGI